MTSIVDQSLMLNVFFLRFGNFNGTTFTLTAKDRQYLITAKHIFKVVETGSVVEFDLFNKDWKNVKGVLTHHPNPKIDVSIVDIGRKIITDATDNDFIPTSQDLVIGQDLAMLGFPYGLFTAPGERTSYPTPFVKKAVFSAIDISEDFGGILYLDGHNNPGFSGGPVAFFDYSKKKAYIVGVISGYIPQNGLIETPFGDWNYKENSGIVMAYCIEHALQIIHEYSSKNT